MGDTGKGFGSLTGMLRITAYEIPEVDNPPPRKNPMIGCPFLDALSPEEARNVLRQGMADWHTDDAQWRNLIDKVLGSVADPLPSAQEEPRSEG